MVASLSHGQEPGRVADIPVIDLAPYLNGEPGALPRAAAQLRDALETIGFFIIINHGVPRERIAQTFAEAKRFHDQPMAVKTALRMNEHNNGYMAMGRYAVWTSHVNDNDKPDLNEAFFLRRERQPDDPLLQSGRLYVGANRWPETLDGFRERILQYTDAMDELSRKFMPICAVALDLPPDYFDAAFAESQFTFRLSHYPPVAAEVNQFGIAPHTDANVLTFLAQTDVPGLQVHMPDGTWQDVPYLPNSYAVNSGDMMYRWTNGRFKSTPHRAVPPVGQDRYAIPFFLGPHIDTLIECLPTCQSPDHPPRFAPMTYDAYLRWWYKANYDASLQEDLDETAGEHEVGRRR
jgi:isopenicillin N synthase-like dioxygenase